MSGVFKNPLLRKMIAKIWVLGGSLVLCFMFGNIDSSTAFISADEGCSAPETVFSMYTRVLGGELDGKWNNLVSWITENGGFIDPRSILATGNKSGVRGMFATEDIAKDTVLARIPASTLLSDGQEITDWCHSTLDLTSVSGVLALARELHKGKDSHFRPWIQLMPSWKQYSQHHPLAILLESGNRDTLVEAWNDVGPSFGDKILEQANAFGAFVQACVGLNSRQKLFQDEVLAEDNMRLAIMAHLTRRWSAHGFTPFADMFNHRNENCTVDISNDEDSGEWLIKTKVHVNAEEEMFHSYGVHDNVAMFSGWGFCDWNKKRKFKRILIDLQRGASTLGHAIDFLLNKISTEAEGRFYVTEGGFSPALRKLLRTSSLKLRDLNELMLMHPDNPTLHLDEDAVSMDNEWATLGKGLKLVKKVREQFTKPVEEYESLSDSQDYVIATLAKIVVEDIKTLENFENSVRQNWLKHTKLEYID